MAIKRCPKCGSDTIMAKVIYGATVQSLEDGTFKIIQQGKKFEVEPVQCMHCKSLFTNGMNDLVEMQVCKTCGKPSLDIDENGECDICRTMKTRPELANMSTNDLIRMVLQLEKKASEMPQVVQLAINKTEEGTSTSVEPMNPPAEEKTEVTNTAAEKVAAAQKAIEQANVSGNIPEEEPPKKTKRTVKKKGSEDVIPEQQEASQENINTENASVTPLNDVDPFSANTDGFNMFDQPTDAENQIPEDIPMPMFEDEQAF